MGDGIAGNARSRLVSCGGCRLRVPVAEKVVQIARTLARHPLTGDPLWQPMRLAQAMRRQVSGETRLHR